MLHFMRLQDAGSAMAGKGLELYPATAQDALARILPMLMFLQLHFPRPFLHLAFDVFYCLFFSICFLILHALLICVAAPCFDFAIVRFICCYSVLYQ
jgi:hypothetical protein